MRSKRALLGTEQPPPQGLPARRGHPSRILLRACARPRGPELASVPYASAAPIVDP